VTEQRVSLSQALDPHDAQQSSFSRPDDRWNDTARRADQELGAARAEAVSAYISSHDDLECASRIGRPRSAMRSAKRALAGSRTKFRCVSSGPKRDLDRSTVTRAFVDLHPQPVSNSDANEDKSGQVQTETFTAKPS
jgi:hypothetical protein